MNEIDFAQSFRDLTGHTPFPWQSDLYEQFVSGEPNSIPAVCQLPTGMGKTSVIAIWLIAVAARPNLLPRRLVYVVNRNAVLDQPCEELERYSQKSVPGIPAFSISTIRGRFADCRNWTLNPTQPSVICGTVDTIGSRLLFSGYGVTRSQRPLHAGLLGQDVLIVHDDAPLEPAFQTLLRTIEKEQKRCGEFRPFHVMELSSIPVRRAQVFPNPQQRQKNSFDPEVTRRLRATKRLHLQPILDETKLADYVTNVALKYRDAKRNVLVFVRKVEDVVAVTEQLHRAGQAATAITGAIRGRERDQLAIHPIVQRFRTRHDVPERTAYLVCTNASEVSIDISADHLVCDLSTWDSMVQRIGRVNRYGDCDDSTIDVLHPLMFEHREAETRRANTLKLFNSLEGDASPFSLDLLAPEDCITAFAPIPTTLPASDILFDAWALTTIRGRLPGRPAVEPYLHGQSLTDGPETYIAWRDEVGVLTSELREIYKPAELLEVYPLKPHELLREPSYRVYRHFVELAKRNPNHFAWVVDRDGHVIVVTLNQLAHKDLKDRFERKIVILDPRSGGLSPNGTLDGHCTRIDLDVSQTTDRRRIWDEEPDPQDMSCLAVIHTVPQDDDRDVETGVWSWWAVSPEVGSLNRRAVSWEAHVHDVVTNAKAILDPLQISSEIKEAVLFAARFHDHGMLRKHFQTFLGNQGYPAVSLAKTSGKGLPLKELYRHELGSMLDVSVEPEFLNLTTDQQDLVLHLIGAHHGRARPHFPSDEVFDPNHAEPLTRDMAMSVPRRFAQLQAKYGRWGVAYLESLLRTANRSACAEPSDRFAMEELP